MTTEFGEFTNPGHQRDLSATTAGTSAKERRHLRPAPSQREPYHSSDHYFRQALPAAHVAMIAYNAEPSLDELLGDHAARLLMAADGVQEDALRELLGRVKKARRTAFVALPRNDSARPRTLAPEFRRSNLYGDKHLEESTESAI